VFFIDDRTGEESLLDVSEIEGANWRKTLVYVLPNTLWNLTGGRLLPKKEPKETAEETNEEDGSSGGEQSNGKTLGGQGKHAKAEKVGGRRKAKKRN
jgi:hypothetical protein